MKNSIEKTIKIIKRTFIGFGAFAIIAMVAAISSEDTEPKQAVAKTEEVKPVTKPIETKPATVEPEPIKNNEQEEKEQIIFETLKNSYEGVAKVTFDSKMKSFSVEPTDPNFVMELAQVINGENLESYNYLVSSFQEGSQNIENTLGKGYVLTLLNPANPANSLIVLMDGEVIYKFK